MKTVMQLLAANPQVSDYKINIHKKESYELFFVKGKLETLRCTDTCDKEVTVYVDHGEYKGESQFFVYPSTSPAEIENRIREAVEKSLLINNKYFTLPGKEEGSYAIESNFSDYDAADLASRISDIVFSANTIQNASLNSVEVFINKHTEEVLNSCGLHKTQVRYDAMVEAIPTYNGEKQSVELYEQYNFAALDEKALFAEIAGKMAEVKARYEAVTPDDPISCPVVLNIQEVSELSREIASDLNFASVYSHANLFKKGDAIQKSPVGDCISITMAGQVPGSIRSSCFDSDGMSLGSMRIVDKGVAVNYYGGNRYGQYLGETPTGNLPCLVMDPGTEAMPADNYLEVISMSGLQVDFYNDYIGGEIRLAYLHKDGHVLPVTGISISGGLSDVLSTIRLSPETGVFGGYAGPEKALLQNMKVF